MKIYITYTINPHKELIISSYHEKTQSLSNAAALFNQVKRSGDPRPKLTELQKLEGEIPDSFNDEIVKKKLLELLTDISKKYTDFNKVFYKGDLNLCTQKKEDVAPYLFDGTLNHFFSGKDVHLILESSSREYVDGAIEVADKVGLTGAVIQTKSGVPKSEAISKEYPKSIIQDKEKSSEMDLSIPKPEPSELAHPKVKVQDPHTLSHALNTFGIYTSSTEEDASTVTPSDDAVKTKTPGQQTG